MEAAPTASAPEPSGLARLGFPPWTTRGPVTIALLIVMAAHRVDDLLPYATRVVVLDGGRVRFDGTPDEVFGQHLVTLRDELGIFVLGWLAAMIVYLVVIGTPIMKSFQSTL